MTQPIRFYNCEAELKDKLKEVEGSLIAALMSSPFLLQFVLDQIAYLEISRHLAVDAGDIESKDVAKGIKEAIYGLSRLVAIAYPKKQEEEIDEWKA